ncbi:MAG: hypothetical protein ACI311_04245 [Bacilli bacterium]
MICIEKEAKNNIKSHFLVMVPKYFGKTGKLRRNYIGKTGKSGKILLENLKGDVYSCFIEK